VYGRHTDSIFWSKYSKLVFLVCGTTLICICIRLDCATPGFPFFFFLNQTPGFPCTGLKWTPYFRNVI
jgi:hypothetical protein